jgi:hypothetical protein
MIIIVRESDQDVENAKITRATPIIILDRSNVIARLLEGREAITSEATMAPTPDILISVPCPPTPTCSMSLANTGISIWKGIASRIAAMKNARIRRTVR